MNGYVCYNCSYYAACYKVQSLGEVSPGFSMGLVHYNNAAV